MKAFPKCYQNSICHNYLLLVPRQHCRLNICNYFDFETSRLVWQVHHILTKTTQMFNPCDTHRVSKKTDGYGGYHRNTTEKPHKCLTLVTYVCLVTSMFPWFHKCCHNHPMLSQILTVFITLKAN